MSELAMNQYGETFLVSNEATHWMVRRMSDVPRGGPLPTFDADGRPIVIPIDTSLAQFHQLLREHGCTAGKYRLDPLDRTGRALKGTPAYLPFPPDRKGGAAARSEVSEASERPRNGNLAAMPMAMPPSAGWSTGGAFPLPVPAHLTGAEYLLGEALRGQVAMNAVQAQALVQLSAGMGGAMANLMNAAADLVRAADGASMPKRRPVAEREAPVARMPQVIVQQVAPPVAYEDELDDDDDGDGGEPAKPPGWTDKIGEVVGQLAPMAQMMIQQKLADLVGGGGGDLGGLGALFGGPGAATGGPRNAAPVAEPAVEAAPEVEEPEVDPTPEALGLLQCVLERLGTDGAGKALRQELRLLDADGRAAFALDLWPLSVDEACEEAVVKVAGIRVRRSRAMIAAERARGDEVTTREYDGRELVTSEPIAGVPPVTAAVATAIPESDVAPADGQTPPGYEHVRTLTDPTTGRRTSHYRPIDPSAPRAPTSTPRAPAAGAGLAAMLRSLQTGRESAIGDLIGSFPGGAAGIESILSEVSPDVAAQLASALGAAAPANVPATATPAGAPTGAAPPLVPTAPVSNQAAMQRLMEILPHLAPNERAVAQTIATSLPADKRALLMTKLVSVPLEAAVAIVKDIVATHAAHGHPYR